MRGRSIDFLVTLGLCFGGGCVPLPHATAAVGGLPLTAQLHVSPSSVIAPSPPLQRSTDGCAWASLVGCLSLAYAFVIPS